MKKKETNQCSVCVWGKSTGLRYHCIFPRCVMLSLKYENDLWERQGEEWIRLKGVIEIENDSIRLQTYRNLKPGCEIKWEKDVYCLLKKVHLVDLDVGFKVFILSN